MGKHRNESGFTAVEGLLILLVAAVIGFGGYYVWHTQQDKSNAKVSFSSQNATKSSETKQQPTTQSANQTTVEISDDIVVCSVNPAAQSGGGLKVAFYGYVKNNAYTKIRVEYGSSSDNLNLKTADFPNSEDDCSQFLAYLSADSLSPGKYYYRVAAATQDDRTVYSKTDSFTKQ